MKTQMLFLLALLLGCSKSSDPTVIAAPNSDPNFQVPNLVYRWYAYGGYYDDGQYFPYYIVPCGKGGCFGGRNINLPRIKLTDLIAAEGIYYWGKSFNLDEPQTNYQYKLAGDSIMFGHTGTFMIDSVWHYTFDTATNSKIVFWRKLKSGNCSGCRINFYYEH